MKHITQINFNKFWLLLMLCFPFMESHAAANRYQLSSLQLFLPRNGEHKITLDQTVYTGVYDQINMDLLDAGNHRLKVVQFRVSRNGRVIEKFVIYNGIIFIPQNSKTIASINPYGRFIIENVTYFKSRSNQNSHHRNGRSHDCNSRNNNSECSNTECDDYSSNCNSDYSNDRQTNSRREFSNKNENNVQLTIEVIRSQSFDSDRLKIAKNLVNQQSIYSSEVAEIMKTFSFESSRLEFAKYAYSRTIDNQNYVKVYDTFQFKSSISELLDYIDSL